MTVSVWLQSDVVDGTRRGLVVVGGGVVGVSAAVEAHRLGLDVLLLERHRLAWGASGRNAGYLMRGMAENYAAARATLGVERARAVWRWSEENLESLRSLGVAGTDGFADRPSCLVAIEEGEAEQLARAHAALVEDGFDAALIERGARVDTLWARAEPLLGLVNPGDAVCHPVRLVERLAAELPGDRVRTGIGVGSVEPLGDGFRLRTTAGAFEAERVMVCTNAHAAELVPGLAGVVVPRRGQMLAARASGVTLEYAYYLNNGDEYIRMGADGEILMGGARAHEPAGEAGEHGGTADAVQRELEGWVRRLATDAFDVTHRWSGTMGFAPGGLPVVGPVGAEPKLWVAAGFTGHGMSLGHITARRAVEAMMNEERGLPPFSSPGRD